MPRPGHFEIHVQDAERAMRFYGELFGWRFKKWDGGAQPYWMVFTGEGPGIDGGLLPRRGPPPAPGQPVNAYPCTTEVPDLDRRLAAAASLGGAVVVPKIAIQGFAWVAYCTDTEGNIFGMLENDPSAK